MSSSSGEDLIRACILIVSDSVYAGTSVDKSFDGLKYIFETDGNGQFHVSHSHVVPDDKQYIQEVIDGWCDWSNNRFTNPNLVITTGGTGFAQRDVTPEAVGPLIHRHAPGIVHAMLSASMQITPFAMMSRPVAGVRNNTLIITLPGSPKGAKENLQSILKLLPHACLQAAGMDSRAMHSGGVEGLEKDAGIGKRPFMSQRHDHSHNHMDESTHTHNHGHQGHQIPRAHTKPEDRPPMSNDPMAGAGRRYRDSPYPMISVEEATKLILQNTLANDVQRRSVDQSLVGCILAEDVVAEEAVPAFRASIVDGYAVAVTPQNTNTKGIFKVASISHAAPGLVPALHPGEIARITTGAPLPPGATSVVMVEDTVLKSLTADGTEEAEVEILADQIQVDENVREVGSDIKLGEVVLRSGSKIGRLGSEIGLLASVGRKDVLVYRKPRVGILSTGDEVVSHLRDGPLRLGEVRDCNRPTLVAVVNGWGYEAVDLGVAKDASGQLEESLRLAMRQVEVIITTGGVSMGELDLLKPTIERSLGGTIHFGRVSMKPGKPTTFATIPFKNNQGEDDERLIFALPGNPASAVVTAHLFVLPSLMRASGEQATGLPRIQVTLEEEVRCDNKREEYVRASITVGAGGKLHATVTGGQRSSRIASFRSANGLLILPGGGGMKKSGELVNALLMGPIEHVVS